jgi:DNA-binding MarR family transcriptional regulator
MPDRRKSMSLASVLLHIRDARLTKGAKLLLLYTLALRCQPDKAYMCWPSYEQLALDTQLNIVTLKRAAQKLEEAGYISRVVRPNHSNKFFINMRKIQDEALTNRAADHEAREARKVIEADEAPFELPTTDDAHADTSVNDYDDTVGIFGDVR